MKHQIQINILSLFFFRQFYLGNKLISRVTSTKMLGLHIDEKLSCTKQIDDLFKKISSTIGSLKGIRQYVSYKALLVI